MERRPSSLAIRATASLLLAGCGGSGLRPEPRGWCSEPPLEEGTLASVVTVTLLENMQPENAPHPTNDSEALVFRHLYEGLTDLDCRGEPVPALAESWSSEDDGVTWTFRLRAGAHFTDGGPADAAGVLEAWRHSRRAALSDPSRFALWWDVRLRDVVAAGTTLTIRLAAADPDLPRLLAAPEFAVFRHVLHGWPLGTRDRAILDRYESGRTVWSVEAANREVRFVLAPDTDPRDALLPDVDLLVTRRRAALEHFAALADVRVTPLPWSRVYVVSATSFWPGGPSDEVLHELADQVLGASARPAESAILDAVDAVPEADTVRAPGRVPIPASRTLVAPAEDADAVALAERIASRWARDIGPVIVTPRDAAGTAQAAARGEAPVVLALARGPATVAHQRRRIEALAPEGAAPPRPLVVTRATLVSRADVAGVTWGYDGVPRLDQVRRLDAAP